MTKREKELASIALKYCYALEDANGYEAKEITDFIEFLKSKYTDSIKE